MDEQFATIRADLAALRDSNPPPDVFGGAMHRFRTHPPLTEDDVRQFEQKYRITLPGDYRGFLIHVGNGGAGPAYGLFKLGEMNAGWGYAPWAEGDFVIGTLSASFPHSGPWNDLSGEPREDEEVDPEFEEAHNHWTDEVYWNPANVNGAVPICHLGCALRQWLVVTGPEAGNVWFDGRAAMARGISPLAQASSDRVTFLQWYRSWLDEALRTIGR